MESQYGANSNGNAGKNCYWMVSKCFACGAVEYEAYHRFAIS